MLDSLEEKNEDTPDQKLKKKLEDKRTHLTSPVLGKGDKEKEGGGGGGGGEEELSRIQVREYKNTNTRKIQKQGVQVQVQRVQVQAQGDQGTETKMGNICSALKPPKKVREQKRKSYHSEMIYLYCKQTL